MKANIFRPRDTACAGLIAVAAATFLMSQPAQAQNFFEWLAGEGGKNTVSDRQTVRFDPSYEVGEIIVKGDTVMSGYWNDPEATARLAAAIRGLGMPLAEGTLPMRASEDFGRFGAAARSAMFCLGAGEAHPPLHAPDYDFPDALIGPGVRIFSRLVDDLLG